MVRNTDRESKDGGGRMGTRSTPGREPALIVSDPRARTDRSSAKREAPSVTGNTDPSAKKARRVEKDGHAEQDGKGKNSGAASSPVTSVSKPHKHPAGRQDDHKERFKYVDLQLPEDKLPEPFKEGSAVEFTEAVGTLWASRKRGTHLNIEEGSCVDSHTLVPAIGSQGQVHAKGDTGLFGVILEVWSNHWVLRTSPEDWWVPVLSAVAKRVDEAANHPSLRAYFLAGREGKEHIKVAFDEYSIDRVDYTVFFDTVSAEINKRIKVPGYVSAVTSDFGTSTPVHRIASQIALMKSFKKYFIYELGIAGCGIKGLEMLGTADDWARLRVKLGELRKLLSPIEDQLKLSSYFGIAEEVFANLARSYADGPSMSDWWATVLCDDVGIKYGPSGIRKTVKAYNGWLVQFMTGNQERSFLACNLAEGKYAEQLSCLSACPLVVDLPEEPAETCALVAGMMGWHAHHPAAGEGNGGVVSLQPAHGWCLLVPPGMLGDA